MKLSASAPVTSLLSNGNLFLCDVTESKHAHASRNFVVVTAVECETALMFGGACCRMERGSVEGKQCCLKLITPPQLPFGLPHTKTCAQ